MKTMTIFIASIFLSGVYAEDRKQAFWTLVPVTNIEIMDIEAGPDGADDVKLIIEGYLPDSCYRPPIKVVRVRGDLDYNVDVYATAVERQFCVEQATFFEKTIDLKDLEQDIIDVGINPNSDLEMEERFILD